MDAEIGEEDYSDWIKVKRAIQRKNHCRNVQDGEVWWCSFGENIGVEMNGKGKSFIRPAIVLKRLSRYSFMAVPITTAKHSGDWYVLLKSRKIATSAAVLSQARVISTARIDHKDTAISRADLEAVREGFWRLYCKE